MNCMKNGETQNSKILFFLEFFGGPPQGGGGKVLGDFFFFFFFLPMADKRDQDGKPEQDALRHLNLI